MQLPAHLLWKAAALAAGYRLGREVVHIRRRYDFTGRTVLITGGSRGLGLILARHFADAGANLVICSRHVDELARATWELRGRGARVVAHVCDVTEVDQTIELMRVVHDQLGGVDVLVNNAGVIQVGPLDTMTAEDFESAMAIHFHAPLRLMEHVIPDMQRTGGGRIINIASFGGQIAVPHLLPYCASKFALVGLSQGMRSELAQHNIYVTTVCPGLMRTGSHRRAWFKGKHRLEYAWFSLGASAPLLSMNADRAAQQIINASRYGRAEITLSIPAKLATLLHRIAPETTADLASVVASTLPASAGQIREVEGRDSQPPWWPRWLASWTDRTAPANNEG